MNAYVQSKADTKKLELSGTKCVKMHVGKDDSICPQLNAHDKEMLTKTKEKYLGDVIVNNAKMDENVSMRCDKGVGIINQIFSILKEVSFGMHYFEMGLLFRTSLLINGILFNTEVIHNITEKHIKMLEDCDNMFMRRLFDSEAGTPIESFFIETETLPLRFILQGRQLM